MRKSCVEEPGCLNRVYDVKYRRWSEYNYSMKRSPWGALWPISVAKTRNGKRKNTVTFIA